MKSVIIIPTYNEKENIKILIPLIFELLPNFSVLVTDDNSLDGTYEEVQRLKKLYPNLSGFLGEGERGFAKAYITAFSKVLDKKEAESIIMMDADFAPQLKYLPEMIKKSKDYQIVIGSRYVTGSKVIGYNLSRKIISFLGNVSYRKILRIPIHDYSCGYMVISTKLMEKIDLSKIGSEGYAFISELKYLLFKAGGRFFEVPVTFTERSIGESKFSLAILWEGILTPWRILFRK